MNDAILYLHFDGDAVQRLRRVQLVISDFEGFPIPLKHAVRAVVLCVLLRKRGM